MRNTSVTALLLGSTLLAAGFAFQPTSIFAQEAVKNQEAVKAQEPAKQGPTKPKESAALKAIAASEALYVGAKKCKSCHNKESQGKIYDKWNEMKHSHALEGLKTPEALKMAKEVGIKKPAEAKECLKCHTTAFGLDKKKLHKRFKPDLGVQCETCHGPGSIHVKARLVFAKDAKKAGKEIPLGQILEIPKGEMIMPDEMLCLECHNEESPSYKEFKYGENLETIRHMHPLRKKPRVAPPKKVVKKTEEPAKQDG